MNRNQFIVSCFYSLNLWAAVAMLLSGKGLWFAFALMLIMWIAMLFAIFSKDD